MAIEKKIDDTAQFSMQTSYFLFAMIALSGLIMGYQLYKANQRFRSTDPMPELLSLIPATQEQFGRNPGIAHVGLYIKDFTEFDMVSNNFLFTGILWFLFDPSIVSLETLGKFSFEKGEILSLSAPNTRIVNGKLLARYDIRVRLKTNLVFSLFPFEGHTLYITLDNNYVSPGEIIFDSSQNEFVISPEISITGWKIRNARVYTGYSSAKLERQETINRVPHPRIIFALEYARVGMRQALTITLPLILMFFMSIFSFAIGLDNYKSILTLSSGTMTAIIAYRFVIENLAPKVGYFMLSDYLFFLFLIAVFIVFFINIGLPSFREKYKIQIIVILHFFLLISFNYLLQF